MTTLNVQFSDSTQETIIAYFGSPQTSSEYANLGTVDTDDERWRVFYDAAGGAASALPAATST